MRKLTLRPLIGPTIVTIIGLLLALPALQVDAQDIQTAVAYFDLVSLRYGAINDYTADIAISRAGTVMRGKLSYKRPNLMRIEFQQPQDQVLVSDGTSLWIYVPGQNVVLQQSLRQSGASGIGGIASEHGLQLLRTNYSIAYFDSPEPVALDGRSGLSVVQLRLTWRSTSEGFRQLVLSIDDRRLIRRITGISVNYEQVDFDFFNIAINQGIPPTRFEFEVPPTANLFTDFLFTE